MNEDDLWLKKIKISRRQKRSNGRLWCKYYKKLVDEETTKGLWTEEMDTICGPRDENDLW